MKTKFLIPYLFIAILFSCYGCKKSKVCGYCKIETSTYYVVSGGGGYYRDPVVTSGPTVCDGDGGQEYALDNGKTACSNLNTNSGSVKVETTWIDK